MNWPLIDFEAIVDSRGSGTKGLPQSEWLPVGRHPVIGQGADYVEGWSNRDDLVIHPSPAVVLYGGHTRRAKFVDRPFVPGPNVKILDPSTRLNAKFLFRFLGQLKVESRGYADHFPEVRRCKIPLPPLAEQGQIAAILDAADALRAKRRESLVQLDALVRSVFLDMFGDPVTNPMGWELKRLPSLVSQRRHALKRGPFGGALKKEIFVPEGFKVYEQKHVIYDDFGIGSYFITRSDYERLVAFKVSPNDLLISCSGTIGRIATVPTDAAPGVMNQALLKIELDASRMLNSFFLCLWRSQPFERKVLGMTHGTGMKNMKSMDELKGIDFIMPNIEIQGRFAAIVESVEQQKATQRTHLAELDTLFASLQSRAFCGDI